MQKDDCDAIMFDTFLEPVYQGKPFRRCFCNEINYIVENFRTIFLTNP